VSSSPYDPAELFEEIAQELERGAAHARTAATHFRTREYARMGAHAWAVQGHVHEAQARLARQSRDHASVSDPEPTG
jgi:hypothetical protein